MKMSLEVTVKSASNLPNVERFSKSDPMTVLIFQGGLLINAKLLLFVLITPPRNCTFANAL